MKSLTIDLDAVDDPNDYLGRVAACEWPCLETLTILASPEKRNDDSLSSAVLSFLKNSVCVENLVSIRAENVGFWLFDFDEIEMPSLRCFRVGPLKWNYRDAGLMPMFFSRVPR
jgi:hypothetical protein